MFLLAKGIFRLQGPSRLTNILRIYVFRRLKSGDSAKLDTNSTIERTAMPPGDTHVFASRGTLVETVPRAKSRGPE